MKIINRLFIAVAVVAVIGACDNLKMEGLQDNPNAVTPENASLDDLYNNYQLAFNQIYTASQGNPGAMARMYHAGAFTYRAATTNVTYNGLWTLAYEVLFPDFDALNVVVSGQENPSNFAIHSGSAKIMKAYAAMVLVDLLGDVPFSEAGLGIQTISPKVDPGNEVYAAANTLLDEAIAELTGTSAVAPANDLLFDGDADGWIKFANSIKMRAALNTGDVSTFNSIVSSGNFIDETSEDAEFPYGSQRTNPNSRHPLYNNHYEVGDGDYLSNYYMWLLRSDKVSASGATIVDPRLRYYFYRKVDDSVNQDATTFSCHFSTLPDQAFQPDHWKAIDDRLPYCVAHPDGWSGRDHLNGEGIPPDGPIRTSYGLYPMGGDFDADDFLDTRNNGANGGLGEGVSPIMLASYTDFMRAEAVLRLGANGDARTLLESGIRKSLDKVESFEGLVAGKMGSEVTLRDGSSGTVKELYGMSATSKDNYVTEVLALYDAASDKLDVVMKEFYIAAWGNGLEAYNMYRRTAKPNNMSPGLEVNTGPFPLSFFYPADGVTRNTNIQQKAELDVPVFWQDGSIASQLY